MRISMPACCHVLPYAASRGAYVPAFRSRQAFRRRRFEAGNVVGDRVLFRAMICGSCFFGPSQIYNAGAYFEDMHIIRSAEQGRAEAALHLAQLTLLLPPGKEIVCIATA